MQLNKYLTIKIIKYFQLIKNCIESRKKNKINIEFFKFIKDQNEYKQQLPR